MTCTFPDHGPLQVLNGGQVWPDDALCRIDGLVESVPVLFGRQFKADSGGSAENGWDDGTVEGGEQLLRQV